MTPEKGRASPTAPPQTHARRTGRQRAHGLTIIALLCSGVCLSFALGAVLAPSGAGAARFSTLSSAICNSHHSLAPSSLFISQPEPTQNLSAGGTITGHLGVRVLNYTSAANAIQLYFPSTFFTFPMATGGNFSFSVGPGFVNITGPGWLNPPALTKSVVAAKGISFVAGGWSRLSTQKLSVMATADYGAILVEFRWHWSLQQPNSSTSVSHVWSVPSNFTQSHGTLPSIFFPAPYVSYLGGTGSTAYAGSMFTATLGGNVAGRYFFLEMEYGGGHVVQDLGQTAPANVTTYNVTIPFLNYNHYLVPGTLLIHIHDSCGALLYNKVVHVSFPPEANLTFMTVPSTCGSITFNGTVYTNNETGTFQPSTTAYVFSNKACTGLKFKGWHTTGGVSIQSGHSILVTSDGSLTIDYA